MDIQTRKIEFVQAFLKLQNEELVALLESILNSEGKEVLKPMGVNELNQRIDQSEKDFESGYYKSQEEVFAKYK